MLLRDKTTVKFQTAFPKILCASTAYKGTFVFVRMDKPGSEESIVHTDANGKILYERRYKDIIDFFGQINDKEVIVCNVPESKIDIINLETQKVLQVNNSYAYDDTCSMEMFTFADTKYFAICERGGLNDNRLILTYFDYHGINEESKEITRWESKDNEWTYEHFHGKMNNHSKVGIWKYQHDQELVFSYFDMMEDPKGKYQEVKARINIGAQYGVGDIQLKISYIWENKPNVYWLVALSNKYEHKEKCKNKDGVINNNYVIDATVSKDQATIRETKFNFGLESDGFSFNDQLTDCFGLGGVSVFHTFRHKEGQVLETPVYYVHNES